MSGPILPGATLGVLGGGQLGRMFALEARRMGYRVAVLCPENDSPAAQGVDLLVQAAYDDLDAVARFAAASSVVTFEFENVPAATAQAAAQYAPVRPSGKLLHTTQNRLREKEALTRLGLPVANYAAIRNEADVEPAFQKIGVPAILKTASWGYDGVGQRRVASLSELRAAWTDLGEHSAVLEALVPFQSEVSVVAARGLDGSVELYAPFVNDHRNHILDITQFPANLSASTTNQAFEITRTIVSGLDLVGVLCVELFLLTDGQLLVNEVAPRPHNSGHVTIDACSTNQFEQQVRAICGLPLGATALLAPAAAMANLLGDLWEDGEPNWPAALEDRDLKLHLYGKVLPRKGRKMGHLTALAATAEEAVERVRNARERLTTR